MWLPVGTLGLEVEHGLQEFYQPLAAERAIGRSKQDLEGQSLTLGSRLRVDGDAILAQLLHEQISIPMDGVATPHHGLHTKLA